MILCCFVFPSHYYIQFKAKKGLNDKKIFLLYFMSPRSSLDFLVMSVVLRYNDYN